MIEVIKILGSRLKYPKYFAHDRSNQNILIIDRVTKIF